jgi:hypothetical protein
VTTVKTGDAITTNPSSSSEPSFKVLNPSQPEPGPHANPDLNSFEAVMQAMDAELARQSSLRKAAPKKPFGPERPPPAPAKDSGTNRNQNKGPIGTTDRIAESSKGKGKEKTKTKPSVRFSEYQSDSDIDDGNDENIEAAMEAELQAILEQGGALDDNDDDEVDLSTGTGMDYNLIKNFLESFKSQAGLSGPVGNLVGRLEKGWQLPRDES